MLIAGAGGHAIEVLDVLMETMSEEKVVFFDDQTTLKKVHDRLLVLKSLQDVKKLFASEAQFCLGLGGPLNRKKLYDQLSEQGGRQLGVRSETAIISPWADVHAGADLMKMTFVSSLAKIGIGTLINTRALVHHHAVVGDFCELSPSATLLGGAKVGNFVFVGAGAVILPGVSVCDHTIIGAGAVVNRPIEKPGTYAGNPARKIK
jgi:sugar O-acyltransferase (sialic acid O-acetyltransferase NeuD family)